MSRVAEIINLSSKSREEVESFINNSEHSRDKIRGQIVLYASQGKSNKEIAELLNINEETVSHWRRSFIQSGVEGLKDKTHSGRPNSIKYDILEEKVEKLIKEKKENGEDWTVELLSQECELDKSSIKYILKKLGIPFETDRIWWVGTTYSSTGRFALCGAYAGSDGIAVLITDSKNQTSETVVTGGFSTKKKSIYRCLSRQEKDENGNIATEEAIKVLGRKGPEEINRGKVITINEYIKFVNKSFLENNNENIKLVIFNNGDCNTTLDNIDIQASIYNDMQKFTNKVNSYLHQESSDQSKTTDILLYLISYSSLSKENSDPLFWIPYNISRYLDNENKKINKNIYENCIEVTVKINSNGTFFEKKIIQDTDLKLEGNNLDTPEKFVQFAGDVEDALVKARDNSFNGIFEECIDNILKKNEKNETQHTHLSSRLGYNEFFTHFNKNNVPNNTEILKTPFIANLEADYICEMSNRKAANFLNRVLPDSNCSFKPTSIAHHYRENGSRLLNLQDDWANLTLSTFGFAPTTGQIINCAKTAPFVNSQYIGRKDSDLSENIMIEIINKYNINKPDSYKINTLWVNSIEKSREKTVYVSIDEILVKHQKECRNKDHIKDGRFVSIFTAHINSNIGSYRFVSNSLKKISKLILAFLLKNKLLENYDLIFFTDGAKCIKEELEATFSFRKFSIYIDYYHVKKRINELLSMGLVTGKKNIKEKRKHLAKILGRIWCGNIDDAIFYLEKIPSDFIKLQNKVAEAIDYLNRKSNNISCGALRKLLRLQNSSNRVEQINNTLIAQRQKNNGMSWCRKGSRSLAIVEAAKSNNEESYWNKYAHLKFLPVSTTQENLNKNVA